MLEEPPQEMKIDAEAVQHQAVVINSVRLYNTQVYFKNDDEQNEMAILAMVMKGVRRRVIIPEHG